MKHAKSTLLLELERAGQQIGDSDWLIVRGGVDASAKLSTDDARMQRMRHSVNKPLMRGEGRESQDL